MQKDKDQSWRVSDMLMGKEVMRWELEGKRFTFHLYFFRILTVFFPQICSYIKNYFGAYTDLNQQVKYTLYLQTWKRLSRLNLARIYLLRNQI